MSLDQILPKEKSWSRSVLSYFTLSMEGGDVFEFRDPFYFLLFFLIGMNSEAVEVFVVSFAKKVGKKLAMHEVRLEGLSRGCGCIHDLNQGE